jgi:TonB family protein
MDRLQRKCAIASAGLHLLLAFILIFGPAFLAPSQKFGKSDDSSLPTENQVIQLVPLPLENAVSQPAHPAVQTPTVSAQTQLSRDNTAKLPRVSTTPVNRNTGRAASTPSRPDSRLDPITKILNNVHQGHPGAATIATISGSEGEDDDYAGFVRETYTSHWDLTGAAAGNEGSLTKVSVTIGRNGKVISSQIIRPSGNAEVDRSVQRTLDSVAFIRPFGEEVKEPQRTYTINFNCNAQRP